MQIEKEKTQQDRDNQISSFIKKNIDSYSINKLKKDASYRQYYRIFGVEKNLILMDAPPEKENVVSFIKMTKFLLANDFSVPQIISEDIENGFLLLEDFGDELFNKILSGQSEFSSELDEEFVYRKAIDVLIKLHQIPSTSASLEEYDENKLINESMHFLNWYVEILNGESVNNSLKEEFSQLLSELIANLKSFKNVVVLRDYHADNLIWLNERIGHRKVGLLDYQDALIGSPIYDIVSLLEDARRDVSIDLATKMVTRYLQAFPDITQKDFQSAYAILGLQRNLKIIGLFSRQASLHQNHNYLKYLPRVWRYVNEDLKHPLLLPIKNWLKRIVPNQIR